MPRQKNKNLTQLGFNLDNEDSRKLAELLQYYRFPKAMTVRIAIRNEYERVFGRKESVA